MRINFGSLSSIEDESLDSSIIFAFVGFLQRQNLPQEDSKGIHVCRFIVGLLQSNLRCHVLYCTSVPGQLSVPQLLCLFLIVFYC